MEKEEEEKKKKPDKLLSLSYLSACTLLDTHGGLINGEKDARV